MISKKVCGSCGFYDLGKVAPKRGKETGICRFSPPKPSTDDKGALWPIVNANDWCGKFIFLK